MEQNHRLDTNKEPVPSRCRNLQAASDGVWSDKMYHTVSNYVSLYQQQQHKMSSVLACEEHPLFEEA